MSTICLDRCEASSHSAHNIVQIAWFNLIDADRMKGRFVNYMGCKFGKLE